MAKKIDSAKPIQSDINIITALALIKQLYLDKKISETVYANIKKDYAPKIKDVGGMIKGRIAFLLEAGYPDTKIIEYLTTMKKNPLTLEQAEKFLEEYCEEYPD